MDRLASSHRWNERNTFSALHRWTWMERLDRWVVDVEQGDFPYHSAMALQDRLLFDVERNQWHDDDCFSLPLALDAKDVRSSEVSSPQTCLEPISTRRTTRPGRYCVRTACVRWTVEPVCWPSTYFVVGFEWGMAFSSCWKWLLKDAECLVES